jgi:hypothetical protein
MPYTRPSNLKRGRGKYCSRHCARWSGGRKVNGPGGYVQVFSPEHPRAIKGYVYEHILIAEKALGKFIEEPHEIHHFNEEKGDNKNSNLVVCGDRAYHFLIHARQRIGKRGGDPNKVKICSDCKALIDRTNFHNNSRSYDGLNWQCKPCTLARQAASRARKVA